MMSPNLGSEGLWIFFGIMILVGIFSGCYHLYDAIMWLIHHVSIK